MKIKDLFGVLLTSQDVSLYNACDILEWEGEFKHVPHRYFDCIINNMYSSSTIAKVSFIVINFKKNYTRG
jgi:hypothetical protein